MHQAKVTVAIFLAALAVNGPRAHSQANVIENQTTSVYVDGLKGSDSNSGAILSPFKTIHAAVSKANSNNQKRIGTKVIVNAGVYRETVYIYPVSNQSSVPITVQAAMTGTAIIAASDVLKNWVADSANSSVYSTPWTPQAGTCSLPAGWPSNFAPIALRTEMIYLNGTPLTQVVSYSQLKPGTFYAAYGSVHIWPGHSTDMQTAVVEAANRSKTLSVVGRTNVVLRGLVFRHAANCMNTSGATISSSSNVLVDSVQALWNNWGGLGIFSSTNVTLQNSIASHNGGVGFQANRDQYLLLDFNESDYNNWRGAQAAFYEWGMGGTKMFQMRTTIVQNHFSYNNQAEGLWFDTDNKNILINNATLSGNVTAALQIERNEGPVTLENSHLCSSGVGVNLLTSEQVKIVNNSFYNNGGTNKYQAQIYLAGQTGGKSITDWQTGQTYDLVTKGLVMTGNTFADATIGQNVFGTYLSGNDWSSFANTLSASSNRWFDPNTTNSFKVVNGKFVNLTGWQTATGTDYSSTWSAAASSLAAACAAPVPSFADFNINVNSGNYIMKSGIAVATVRVNSFGAGAVSLSATGMPSGVSASIGNPTLTSGVATLTLSATKYAANSIVPITLWAVSNGQVHSVTFSVHVVPL